MCYAMTAKVTEISGNNKAKVLNFQGKRGICDCVDDKSYIPGH